MARLTRREMLSGSAALLGGLAVGGTIAAEPARASKPGRLRQSVCRWPFGALPLHEFCRAAAELGLEAIDLLQPEEWSIAREYGLACSMGYPANRSNFIPAGFNDPANHPMLLRELERTIPLAVQAGVPNLIGMFGNRSGRSDAQGIANCAAGLRQIAPMLEEHGITLCLELLNSKVDHPDYHGDRTAFGVAVMREVESPRVKLLYDIYHMQVMEGDVIRTIRDNIAHIAHFHTAGVPGRHELNDAQELNYIGVARAVAGLDFTGYFAHEFIPTGDPIASLRQAITVCTV